VCSLCRENLKVKYGSCVGTVPLFKVTKNKELTAKVSGNCSGIVLADLLKVSDYSLTGWIVTIRFYAESMPGRLSIAPHFIMTLKVV
jgi:hypothetical protein